MERKEYWEVTDDELNSGASETMGTAGMMTLSGAAGDAAVSDAEPDIRVCAGGKCRHRTASPDRYRKRHAGFQ